MSIYKDGKLIAGGRQCMPLLSFMWADHILNDASWLRADTFSWQSGSVYQAAYQHLTADITGKTLQSETISGTTIQFYLADDGHKICPASEESNVTAIYNATGIAWYYILDTTNQRFKLPRTKFGFTGIRSGVGGFVEAGLPNITGNGLHEVQGNAAQPSGDTNAFYPYNVGSGSNTSYSGNYQHYDIGFDASRSSSIYGNSDTVQPKATEMYLYFYVGNFTQTALENTAGVTTEVLNTKVTVGHEVVEFQEPTAANNYTWYRKYADGWVEQGGIYTISSSSPHTITLPQQMSSTNYYINISAGYPGVGDNTVTIHIRTDMITTTSFAIQKQWSSNNGAYYWQVSGMAA